MACAISYCLLLTYLNNLGVSPTKRSLMFSIGAVGAMLLQTLIGYLCDLTKKIKPFSIATILVTSCLTYIVYNTENVSTLLVIVMIFFTIYKIVMPIVDSWTLETNETCRQYYGIIRAFGSIGWMAGSFAIGFVANKFGYQALGLFGAISYILSALVALFIKDANKTSTREKIKITDIKKLLVNKNYIIVIVILLFLSMISESHSYLVIGKLNQLSSNSSVISNYFSLSALYELPIMFFSHRVCEKFKNNTLLIVCCVSYFFKFIFYSLSNTYGQMYLASTLQAISYPIIELVGKRLINEQSPQELKSTGLLLAVSIYSCVSSLLTPLACALLEENMSYSDSLLVIALFVLCTLLLVFGKIKIEKKQ